MLPRRIARKMPIEMTAAGTEAETVMPANMPRYAFAPASTTESTAPRMNTPAVSSGNDFDAGMYGSTLDVGEPLGASAMAGLSPRGAPPSRDGAGGLVVWSATTIPVRGDVTGVDT
jgi:hypothetical protein